MRIKSDTGRPGLRWQSALGIQATPIVRRPISTKALHVCCWIAQKAWKRHTDWQMPWSSNDTLCFCSYFSGNSCHKPFLLPVDWTTCPMCPGRRARPRWVSTRSLCINSSGAGDQQTAALMLFTQKPSSFLEKILRRPKLLCYTPEFSSACYHVTSGFKHRITPVF